MVIKVNDIIKTKNVRMVRRLAYINSLNVKINWEKLKKPCVDIDATLNKVGQI